MTEDNRKWLKNYASPCFTPKRNCIEKLPHINEIEEFLQGDYSLNKIRDYFFIPHNLRTIKEARKDFYHFHHLVIPYSIIGIKKEGVIGVVNEPFFETLPIPLCNSFFEDSKIEKARKTGIFREENILRDINLGDIIITHAMEIVDSGTPEEFEKYDSLYA